MIYIVKAFNTKERKYTPHIISFIRDSESEVPQVSNYFLKCEGMNYEDVQFAIINNLNKEKEAEYEKTLIEEMDKTSERDND